MKLAHVNIIKLQTCFGLLLTTLTLQGDGSFVVLNNSLYTIKFIATVQNSGTTLYTQATIAPAPINSDGSLQIHPKDNYYADGSNVPVGTLGKIPFTGTAQNFDLQILDATGAVIKQINIGSTLGAVVDNDPARIVYIYNNVDSAGKTVANQGGAVYFWDANHTAPVIQTF